MPEMWANPGRDLLLDLGGDSRPGRPRVRENLERALREAVTEGRLAPGATLPPSRSLAADLGVARNTVTEAYAQLVAEGWLVARQGSATRVAERPGWEGSSERAGGDGSDADAGRGGGTADTTPTRPLRYDLRAGHPDLGTFPRSEWLAASRVALARAPDSVLGYGDPAGLPQLQAALAGYLARARGVRVRPHRVLVCAGFSSGLDEVAHILHTAGARTVGVEAYGHAGHRAILAGAGLRPVSLPVDAHGAVSTGLDHLDAVLLTPAHQFPLGVALSPRRRGEFAAWSARTGRLVIEDDYDGEFRYDRRALGAIQALAPEHIAYAGTVSKTLVPGLRLGWFVLPEHLVDAALDRRARTRGPAGVLDQLTLAEFLDSGRYDRHVRRVRLTYRRRRDLLVTTLAGRVPQIRATGLSAGLHTVLTLPADVDAAGLVKQARGRELALETLAGYRCEGIAAGPPALVIGYATPPAHAYTTAVARLTAALAAGTS